uniref:RxLR effector candidate protein n=2 Tax=Hyaloperonospora arabidopsidis (strain Emoy2) TaxID=559515 RepID=M4BKC0_HYAAE
MRLSAILLLIVAPLHLCVGEVVLIPATMENPLLRSAPSTNADARKGARSLRALNSAGISQLLEPFTTKVKSFVPRTAAYAAAKQARVKKAAAARTAQIEQKSEENQAALLKMGLAAFGQDVSSAIVKANSQNSFFQRDGSFFLILFKRGKSVDDLTGMLESACQTSDISVEVAVRDTVRQYKLYREDPKRREISFLLANPAS